MAPKGKKPQIFKIRIILPQNRVQQERIRIPQPQYRPIRMRRRDVIIRGLLKESPDYWTLHRRGVSGRTQVGPDQEEARAISEDVIKGTLPERIIYLELIKRGYVPGIDFDFQSSAEGGRNELGGLVVDFVFEFLRIALRVQGPTHDLHIRIAKDREQESILESMGFHVLDIDTDVIANAFILEQWFRQHLDPGGVLIEDPDKFSLTKVDD